jgi:transcriptional regulator with XRE-family HTH domain
MAHRAEELGRQLTSMRLLSGQRIRNLRIVLGWSQREAALQLGVSRRTIIRHEQGRNRHPWVRLSLLERLRELESTYAGELIIYLGLFDPNTPRPPLPAHLERKLAARWQECRRAVLSEAME